MNREIAINKLSDPDIEWDIVVIGGGATGLGVAVDASSRGFKTLLLESHDFAKGTSSRSTKLVHGGVRYLAQGDISLVLEALKERGLMMQNAPHLVQNQKFVIPNYRWWGGPFYTIGLKMYDMMAGKLGLGPSEHISKEEVMKIIPNLVEEDLHGGVIYHDGKFDDSRLAINLAQTVFDHGGYAINYCGVIGLVKDEKGLVTGLQCEDGESGISYALKAKAIVNATGVFVDSILKMDDPESRRAVVPSQGIHIVLNREFIKGDTSIMIPDTSDGRVLFAIPWHNKVVVGTTDTLMKDSKLEPRALEEEIDFLIETAADYLSKPPKRKDVLCVFAGLRPLVAPEDDDKETKEISRSHKIIISLSGLITIIGGKWTTYRQMGEDGVNKAILLAGLPERVCITNNLPIHGFRKNVDFKDHLYVYGSDINKIQVIISKNPEMKEQIHPNLPYIKAEIVWAARVEMALTVEDFLARRTRALFLDAQASIEMAHDVAVIMAMVLGRDKIWIKNQVKAFKVLAKGYLLSD
jgi:glycerol-3-phosphate dehydrogenase